MFEEGTKVSYQEFQGTISFRSKSYVTILIKQGKHRAQDVKIVVYKKDFKLIHAHSS
jgi:hypothetical protein